MVKEKKNSFLSKKLQRWGLHGLYWLGVLLGFTLLFWQQGGVLTSILIFLAFYLPITVGFSLYLNYYLIPVFLLEKRYGKFFLYLLFATVTVLHLYTLSTLLLFIFLARIDLQSMPAITYNFPFLGICMFLAVSLSIAIKQLKRQFYDKQQLEMMRLHQAETELKFIRSQINPHFLFNTLNNLYALTLKQSPKASDAVLQLSSLLHYILYDTAEQRFVPIATELEQIENYIALEKTRYGERVKVRIKVIGSVEAEQIAPMLLLTFVENAFKHGVGKKREMCRIEIELEVEEQGIRFWVWNTKRTQAAKESRGIGLKNIRTHLALVYPKAHTLKISDEPNFFEVKLVLYG